MSPEDIPKGDRSSALKVEGFTSVGGVRHYLGSWKKAEIAYDERNRLNSLSILICNDYRTATTTTTTMTMKNNAQSHVQNLSISSIG